MKNNKFQYQKKSKNKISPLMVASSLGKIKTVRFLIKKKSDINASDYLGRTSLFYAILSDHIDTAALLLKNEANPNHQSKDSLTPLMYGAALGNIKMVRLLIKSGASISDKGRWNEIDAYWWASRYNHSDIMKYFKSLHFEYQK